MKYSIAVIALIGLSSEANAVSIQKIHNHHVPGVTFIGTRDEETENKEDASSEEDPKSPEAVEKRRAIAKDLESRPNIKDDAADQQKKLESDSKVP